MRWAHLATPAGALTLLRLLMAGTLPYALGTPWLLPLYLFALWTDVADGYVARRWNHATRAGAAFDAWVDKSLHVNLGWALALADQVPDWFMLCWFSRELIQLPMHFFLMHRFRTEEAPPPRTSAWGRATALTLALAFCLVLGGWPASRATLWLTVLTGALGAVASLHYAWIFAVEELTARAARRAGSSASTAAPDGLDPHRGGAIEGYQCGVVEVRLAT